MTEIDSDQIDDSVESDSSYNYENDPIIDYSLYDAIEITEAHKNALIQMLNCFIPEVDPLKSFDDKSNVYWRLGTLIEFFTDLFNIFLLFPFLPTQNPVPPLLEHMTVAKTKRIHIWIKGWLSIFYDSKNMIESLDIEDGTEMATMMVLNVFYKLRPSIPQIRSIIESQWSLLKELEVRLTNHVRYEQLTSILLFQLENERIKHQVVERQLKTELQRLKTCSSASGSRSTSPQASSQKLNSKSVPVAQVPKTADTKQQIQKIEQKSTVQKILAHKPAQQLLRMKQTANKNEENKTSVTKVLETKSVNPKLQSNKSTAQKSTEIKSSVTKTNDQKVTASKSQTQKQLKPSILKGLKEKASSPDSKPKTIEQINVTESLKEPKSEPSSPEPSSPVIPINEDETSAFILSLKNLPKKRGRPKRTFFEDECLDEPPRKIQKSIKKKPEDKKVIESVKNEPQSNVESVVQNPLILPKKSKKKKATSMASILSSSSSSSPQTLDMKKQPPLTVIKSKDGNKVLKQNVCQIEESNIHTVKYYLDSQNFGMFCLKSNDQFKCRVCSNIFEAWIKFTEHLTSHESMRVFQCPWKDCVRFFMSNYKLQRHARCHTGERPYKCTECEKAFTRSDKLKDHLKVHQKSVQKANNTLAYSLVKKPVSQKPETDSSLVITLKKVTESQRMPAAKTPSSESCESLLAPNDLIIHSFPVLTEIKTEDQKIEELITLD